ncbi:ComF family protein [Candidatus Azambacteria bacterium]|nr:ComF family protein [Candidatus Azambacteria bacterium]
MALKNFLLDLIFPRYCPGCKKEIASNRLSPICDDCFDKIALNSGIQCHVCGLRNNYSDCLPARDIPEGHKKCQKETSLQGIFSAGRYEDPILREMIHLFKYQSVESFKTPLSRLIIGYLTKENLAEVFGENGIVLSPIPLTLRRKIKRGFNQSELLAEEIGKFLNCPVANLLKRKKFSGPQAEISDWKKRKENIFGAFAINEPIFPILTKTAACRRRAANFDGIKKVILVDDVSTSGATLEEAARVLKNAGIKEVYGIVAAKG